MREYLEKCAGTAMNSKLIASHKQFFSKMVVDAVQVLDDDLDIDMIGVKKESGGAMEVEINMPLCYMHAHQRILLGYNFCRGSGF